MNEDINIDNLSPDQEAKLEKYLGEHCTSRCGNDIDCPHEEEFIEILREELNKEKAKFIKTGEIEGCPIFTQVKKI